MGNVVTQEEAVEGVLKKLTLYRTSPYVHEMKEYTYLKQGYFAPLDEMIIGALRVDLGVPVTAANRDALLLQWARVLFKRHTGYEWEATRIPEDELGRILYDYVNNKAAIVRAIPS